MTPARFTEQTRRLGLYRKFVGPDAVNDLAKLVQTPFPCVAKEGWEERSKAPSTLKHLGKLIATGLAKLNPEDKHYHATPDGREWLGKIIENDLVHL